MSGMRSDRGFTLIEVMLAMTLLSIMVVLLFSSLKIAAESWNKGERKISGVNEKAVVYQFFKRHLTSVHPLWDDFSGDVERFSFRGGDHGFQFVSVFPASAERHGFQLFEISFDAGEEKTVKVILTPFYPSAEARDWQPEEVILLDKVEEFEVAYFDRGEEGENGFWTQNWLEKDQLPALVKIRIGLKDQSYWPEMVFALKLSGSDSNQLKRSGL